MNGGTFLRSLFHARSRMTSWQSKAAMSALPPKADIRPCDRDVRFSNRPFGVKHFQTVRRCSVDVTHGLVLLFGIGTKALVWGFLSQGG